MLGWVALVVSTIGLLTIMAGGVAGVSALYVPPDQRVSRLIAAGILVGIGFVLLYAGIIPLYVGLRRRGLPAATPAMRAQGWQRLRQAAPWIVLDYGSLIVGVASLFYFAFNVSHPRGLYLGIATMTLAFSIGFLAQLEFQRALRPERQLPFLIKGSVVRTRIVAMAIGLSVALINLALALTYRG